MVAMILAVFVLAPDGAVFADDGTTKDRVIIGQNFTLSSGEVIDGDLIVIGGETTIEPDAEVRGDLVVIGASLRMDGHVEDSAIVIGGSASLGASSTVGHDMVALGGAFQRARGASIAGDIITNEALDTTSLARSAAGGTAPAPPTPEFDFDFGPLGKLVSIMFQAISLGAITMLLSAFLHPQLEKVAQVALRQPFAAGSMGLLTIFLAPLAIIILAVTLILIPLALAATMLLVLAWLFGLVALGHLVGERVLQAMHRTWEPVLSAGFGGLILGAVLGTSNEIACVGWLAAALIGLVGLGAATMTLFGTRQWPAFHSAALAPTTPAGNTDYIPPAS